MVYNILAVVYMLGCIALVAVVLLQKKSSSGLGSVAGMGGTQQTYWDKNKGRSLEGKLEKYTKILAAVMAVFTIVMCLL